MSDSERETRIINLLISAYRRGLEDMIECVLGCINDGMTHEELKKKLERENSALHQFKIKQIEELVNCVE